MPPFHIIGGGLAGQRGPPGSSPSAGTTVVVHEMRPVAGPRRTRPIAARELVCSNTFKSTETSNAHGLLKAEMRCSAR
jgi:methylenetetrahydrofolate--tRNA-(uracil-5-)-methyltransferase